MSILIVIVIFLTTEESTTAAPVTTAAATEAERYVVETIPDCDNGGYWLKYNDGSQEYVAP